MTMRGLRLLLVAILCAAAGWTIARMAHEGAWVRGWAGMSVVPRMAVLALAAVTVLPYGLLAFALTRPSLERHRFAWVAAIALLTAGAGAFVIWQALDVARGDQRGLIFLFVPPAQIAGAALALAVSLTSHRRAGSSTVRAT